MPGAKKSVEALHFARDIKHIAAGTATYTLTYTERIVIVTATDNTGDITVTLQAEDQLPGEFVFVKLKTKDTSDVLVKDRHGTTIATLDTSGDEVLCFSDGEEWHDVGGTNT